MTVETDTSREQYVTNGTAGPWTVRFYFLADADLQVIYTDEDGNETTLALGTDYSVTGAGDSSGGTVTTTTAYAATTPASYITILRDMDITQEVDYTETDSFPAETHEQALDRLTMLLQQVSEVVGRALVFAPSDVTATALPAASARASKLLGFTSTGALTVTAPTTGTASALALLLAGYANNTEGAGMVGQSSLLSYAQNTTGQALRDAGRSILSNPNVVGDDTADDSTAINACLALGGHWIIPDGYTFKCGSQLNVTVDGTRISGRGKLRFTYSNDAWIEVSGEQVEIGSGVQITHSAPTYDGSNSRTTLAAIWATSGAHGLKVQGARITNFPRCGIGLEDATQAEIVGNYIVGGYAYADYNEATTTGHAGIFYNPPPDSGATNNSVKVHGNIIGQCIQGFLYGNFDAAGNTRGVSVLGNIFFECWDHAVYCTLGEGTIVSHNIAIDCRRPIVIDGEGCEAMGNVLWATNTTQTNHEQMISVRRAKRSRVIGNYLRGVSASIDCSGLSGDTTTDVSDNLVDGNVLYQTAVGTYLDECIRVGSFALTCTGNKITHNRIYSLATGGDSVVSLQCTGGTGYDNTVARNDITCTSNAQPITLSNQIGASVTDNGIGFSYSAGSATTIIAILLATSDDCYVERNRVNYRSGGTNVTIRAVQVESGADRNTVAGTRCDFSSGSLAAKVGLLDNSGTVRQRDNVWDNTYDLGGSFTLNGAASIAVTNTNVTTSSRIFPVPVNNAAGACMRDKGITVVAGSGSVTFQTSDGTNPAASSDFRYIIQ